MLFLSRHIHCDTKNKNPSSDRAGREKNNNIVTLKDRKMFQVGKFSNTTNLAFIGRAASRTSLERETCLQFDRTHLTGGKMENNYIFPNTSLPVYLLS